MRQTEPPTSTLLDAAEQRIFDIRRGKNMQGLQRINELVLESIDRLELLNSNDEKYKGVATGIRELDDTITGLNRSDLILLAARPGMGKTSFALNIMRHAGVVGKKKVAFFLGNDQGATGFPSAFHGRDDQRNEALPVSWTTTSGYG